MKAFDKSLSGICETKLPCIAMTVIAKICRAENSYPENGVIWTGDFL